MPYFGEIAALITALLWSGTSIAFAEASMHVGPIYVNVTRMFFALTFLTLTILFAGLSIYLSFSQIIFLAISGFIGLVIGDTYLFKAYRLIGARISMLVMSLAPAIAAIAAYLFLGEVLSTLGIIGILVTLTGIAIVVLQRRETPNVNYAVDYSGLFYAFIGAAGQAIGLVFAKLAFNTGEINGFVAAFIRILSALILLFPLVKMTKRYSQPVKKFIENKKGLLFTLTGSVIGPFLGITFSMISISHAKVGIASTLMATVPIIMLLMVRFYYKEKLSWASILGAFIAVGGIALLFLRK